jgi:RHS repeat-associated protein
MFWYHYDGLGSTAGLTKQNGQSTHNYRYEPYGQIEMPPGNFTDPHNHYTFTGQELDENMGLYEFFARAYDYETGTWVQQDIYRGRMDEPGTLHRYGYVEGNPTTYFDLYGLSTEGCGVVMSCEPTPPTPKPIPAPHPTPTPTSSNDDIPSIPGNENGYEGPRPSYLDGASAVVDFVKETQYRSVSEYTRYGGAQKVSEYLARKPGSWLPKGSGVITKTVSSSLVVAGVVYETGKQVVEDWPRQDKTATQKVERALLTTAVFSTIALAAIGTAAVIAAAPALAIVAVLAVGAGLGHAWQQNKEKVFGWFGF